jgi:hypothetical protein
MRKSRRVRFGLALVAALTAAAAAAGPAMAEEDEPNGGGWHAPNVWGTTGLVTIPTAQTMDYREIGAHVHLAPEFKTYGVLYGLYPRLEIGLSFANGDKGNTLGVEHNLSTIPNLKYAIFQEGDVIPAVAVGTTDPFNDTRLGPTFYAVASKSFELPTPLRKWSLAAHGGIGSGSYDNLPFIGADLGVGWPFTWMSVGLPLKLMAEVAAGHFNAGARITGPFGLGGEIGFIDRERGTSFVGAVNFKKQF